MLNNYSFGSFMKKIIVTFMFVIVMLSPMFLEPVDTADIGVVLRALSALRTQRYGRRHSGKKDKQRKRIRRKT